MRCYLACLAATLILVLFSPAPAAGQTIEPGIHVGLAAATFSGKANTDFGFRGSFGAGISVGLDFGNGFLVQPEVRYVAKGGKSDEAFVEGSPGALNVKSTISYLEFPVLLAYRFETRGTVHPKVFLGPFVARKLDSTIEWQLASGGTKLRDSDDSIVSTDYGFVVGAGLEIDVMGERLVAATRATFGRKDVRDLAEAPLHNTGLEFSLGLVLR